MPAVLPWSYIRFVHALGFIWISISFLFRLSVDSYSLARQLGGHFYDIFTCLGCHIGQSPEDNCIIPGQPCNGSLHISSSSCQMMAAFSSLGPLPCSGRLTRRLSDMLERSFNFLGSIYALLAPLHLPIACLMQIS